MKTIEIIITPWKVSIPENTDGGKIDFFSIHDLNNQEGWYNLAQWVRENTGIMPKQNLNYLNVGKYSKRLSKDK